MGTTERMSDVWEPRNICQMYGNRGTHMSGRCMGTTEYMSERYKGTTKHICQRCMGTTEHMSDIWEPRNTYVRKMYGNHGIHMSERYKRTTNTFVREMYGNHGIHMSERCMGSTKYMYRCRRVPDRKFNPGFFGKQQYSRKHRFE
jgi:hypothetical protein